jgi:nicotinamide-nucleotide adenylyltransferase
VLLGKKLPVALFIGRFQPFHKGHLFALGWIARRCRRVVVAIGSAQEKGTMKNPLSAQERKKIIRAGLSEANLLHKCDLCLVPDIPDNSRWVAHVDAHMPAYDVCFSNNALVLRLMRRAGKRTARVPFLRRSFYNATAIRERMREGKAWKGRVQASVWNALKEMED